MGWYLRRSLSELTTDNSDWDSLFGYSTQVRSLDYPYRSKGPMDGSHGVRNCDWWQMVSVFDVLST